MSRPPTKLRSTCRSCADSKVKCNKKKPTCSRCEARCIPCEYVQARRPGRVPGSFARASSHASRSSTASLDQRVDGLNEGQTNAALLSLAATPFGLSCACGTTIHRREPFTNTPPDDILWEDTVGMDIDPLKLLSMSNMVDSNSDFTVAMDLMPSVVVGDSSTLDPNGQLNNQTTNSATHSPTSLGLSYPSASAASSDISSLGPSSLCSAMNRVDPTDQASTSNYGNAQSPSHHLEGLQSDGFGQSSDQPTCQCMQQALIMLKILSGPRGSLDTQMPGHDLAAEFVKNNNRDITAVLNILACKLCKHDSFLFMIVLTITTKILARYASTASMRGSTNPASGSASSVCSLSGSTDKYAERLVDIAHALGEKGTLTPVVEVEVNAQSSLREAAQRVLQELHRIHKLISELAIRCKELDQQESRPSSSQPKLPAPVAQPCRGSNGHKQNHLATTFMATAGKEISTPLSVRTFDLMIGDMRRSMAMLSVVLRGVLRNS